MHLCVISDFRDKSFQDYFILSCEVATKTGTPLFSSGIFWTGTVLPQPPALSLAHPCLCQILLEPSSAHLLKEKERKQNINSFVSNSDNHWTAEVKNPLPLWSYSEEKFGLVSANTADQITHPLPTAACSDLLVARHQKVISKWCSAVTEHHPDVWVSCLLCGKPTLRGRGTPLRHPASGSYLNPHIYSKTMHLKIF